MKKRSTHVRLKSDNFIKPKKKEPCSEINRTLQQNYLDYLFVD